MSDAPAFGARVTGLLLAAGIALAGLYAVLTAYAPDLRPGQDGGAHALSNAATGFSGLVALAQATGMDVSLSRDPAAIGSGLLVLTPPPGVDPRDLEKLVRSHARSGSVLIVLPKWLVRQREDHPGWVETVDLVPIAAVAAPVLRLERISIGRSAAPAACCIAGRDETPGFAPPPRLQLLSPGPALLPVLTDPSGRIVVARLVASNAYVLADPDLLNNHALKDPATARAALVLLAKLADGGPVAFDLSLNGFARGRNIARLAFEPPFLALTLCLVAAAALAGLQAAVRFGAPRAPPRAIAFGKRTLVDNAAALIRSARREPAMATRYARLMLETAGTVRGAPAGLSGPALGQWLDRRASRSASFDALDRAAHEARTRDDGLAAARALHAWKEDVTHDR